MEDFSFKWVTGTFSKVEEATASEGNCGMSVCSSAVKVVAVGVAKT